MERQTHLSEESVKHPSVLGYLHQTRSSVLHRPQLHHLVDSVKSCKVRQVLELIFRKETGVLLIKSDALLAHLRVCS